MFDGEAVLLQAEDPAHEARSGATLHGVAHSVKPAQGDVIDAELKLSAPEVRAPVLDSFDSGEEFDFSDSVSALVGGEFTAVVRDGALSPVVVELAEHST